MPLKLRVEYPGMKGNEPCYGLTPLQTPHRARRGGARLRLRFVRSTSYLPPERFHLPLKFFKLSAVPSHCLSRRENIFCAFRKTHGVRATTSDGHRQN